MGAFYSLPRRARNLLNGPRRRAPAISLKARLPRAREFISSRWDITSVMYTHSFSRSATKYKGESNFSSNARFPPENSARAHGANYDRPTTSPTTSTPTPFSGQRIFMPSLTGDFWKISVEWTHGFGVPRSLLRLSAEFGGSVRWNSSRVWWNEKNISSRFLYFKNIAILELPTARFFFNFLYACTRNII